MAHQPQWLPPVTPAPPPYVEQRTRLIKRLLAPALVALAFVLKFSKLVLGAKFLTTSASMLVSIGAYALIWGWKFGVGFVALLFVHEMGHFIQLRREGVKPTGMLFIPFLGAVVGARSLGGNALAEARVGLAGPILGSLGAAALIPVANATGNDLYQALAFTGFFLNLINLIPVLPLDGGRAFAAMAPWMWFVGLGVMVALMFLYPSPIVIIIVLVGGYETYRRWKIRKAGGGEEGNADYYRVAPRHRLMVFAVYVGLIALLALGIDATHIERTFDDV